MRLHAIVGMREGPRRARMKEDRMQVGALTKRQSGLDILTRLVTDCHACPSPTRPSPKVPPPPADC